MMTERFSRLLDAAAAFAMILASSAMIWTVASRRPPAFPTDRRETGVAVEQIEIANAFKLRDGPATNTRLGPKFAFIEFSDFQCPYCGRFARDVYPTLRRDFVDSGRLKYVFRHFPLETIHPFALKAAEAVECAGQQGKYWELHDHLFANQQALSQEHLLEYAKTFGLDTRAFQTCMDGQMTAFIREDLAIAQRLGISSTPTFFIAEIQSDGQVRLIRRILGAQPYQTFKTLLDQLVTEEVGAVR
jgi:protein-disulfide isomerase